MIPRDTYIDSPMSFLYNSPYYIIKVDPATYSTYSALERQTKHSFMIRNQRKNVFKTILQQTETEIKIQKSQTRVDT